MTEPNYKTNAVSRDPESTVRMLARAVIRRVRTENPACFGGELRLRLSAANPFGTQDESVKEIWQEEITWALQSQAAILN